MNDEVILNLVNTNRGANVTETCVSQDFVCDGQLDCSNGEDEKTCRTVKGTRQDP